MGFWESFAAREAAEAASKKLYSYDDGVQAYRFAGKVFIACGVGWLLMGLPAFIFQRIIWLFVVGGVQIALGVLVLVLCRKSARFREWAKKDLKKEQARRNDPEYMKKLNRYVLIGSIVVIVVLFGGLWLAEKFG